MRRIAVDRPDASSRLRHVLSRGGVAVVPTDTLYGLSAAMSSRSGYDRIASIKQSGTDRRFLYLANDIGMVERYIDGWGCASRQSLDAVWPAPFTAVLRSGDRCPSWVGKTIALRVPRHPFVRSVIEALGEPIVSTSANEKGEPPLEDLDAIVSRFGARVDLIVDAGVLIGRMPSTLVDFTGEEPVVLRVGDYLWGGMGKPSK